MKFAQLLVLQMMHDKQCKWIKLRESNIHNKQHILSILQWGILAGSRNRVGCPPKQFFFLRITGFQDFVHHQEFSPNRVGVSLLKTETDPAVFSSYLELQTTNKKQKPCNSLLYTTVRTLQILQFFPVKVLKFWCLKVYARAIREMKRMFVTIHSQADRGFSSYRATCEWCLSSCLLHTFCFEQILGPLLNQSVSKCHCVFTRHLHCLSHIWAVCIYLQHLSQE
jgi:hypothetical protein